MISRVPRFVVGIVTVSLVIVGLSACARATTAITTPTLNPVAGHHTARPSATPPAPAPLDTVAPAARANVPCSSFVTTAQVTAELGPSAAGATPAQLAAGDLALNSNMLSVDGLPTADYIRAAGGIDCLWTTGPLPTYPTQDTTDPSITYLSIQVLFDAADSWNTFNGVGNGDDVASCDAGSDGHAACLDDHLVGGNTWVEISGEFLTTGDDNFFMNLQNTVFAKIAAAAITSSAPATQAGTRPVGTQCSDFVADATVASALSSPSPTVSSTSPLWGPPAYILGALPLFGAAAAEVNDSPCGWTEGGATVAELAWIPGGAWAWNENRTQTLAGGTLQPLALAGLHVNDKAWVRCAAANASCTADLVLGGNWIEVTLPSSSLPVNKRTAITTIANAIVAKVG